MHTNNIPFRSKIFTCVAAAGLIAALGFTPAHAAGISSSTERTVSIGHGPDSDRLDSPLLLAQAPDQDTRKDDKPGKADTRDKRKNDGRDKSKDGKKGKDGKADDRDTRKNDGRDKDKAPGREKSKADKAGKTDARDKHKADGRDKNGNDTMSGPDKSKQGQRGKNDQQGKDKQGKDRQKKNGGGQ